MSVSLSAAEILGERVVLELECLDRLYLNVYQPKLQREIDVFRFLRSQRGKGALSSRCFQSMTHGFVQQISAFALTNKIPMGTFPKGVRKEEAVLEHRPATFTEGIYFIGRNQEKASTFRTEGRRNQTTGQTYPWIVKASAMVNQYYFYGLDDDFGPFFLKFSSYFPYTARLCINGHEFVKRQLTKAGIAFEPLDNGLFSCADPKRAQAFARLLTPERINALLRKWLRRLPHLPAKGPGKRTMCTTFRCCRRSSP